MRKMRYRLAKQVVKERTGGFRRCKRRGRLSRFFWFGMFPNMPISGKTRGMRMGKGKGDPRGWCYLGYEGTILIRITGVLPIRL